MDGIKYQKEVQEGKCPHFPRHIKFLDFCLKGSKKFADRRIIFGKHEKCEENDYDISKLKDFFKFKGNEPIVRTTAWDKPRNKNNLQLSSVADLDNKTYSQYATARNVEKVGDLSKNSLETKEELTPWDLRKYEKNVIEDKSKAHQKTRENEEQER